MGDVKKNKEQLRKAIDFAKKQPDHPDSIELRNRLERGMFNVELKALGKEPFPVKPPKVDLKAAMASAQPMMQPGQQSKLSDAPSPDRGVSGMIRDAVGGAMYGFSAPGRTIQNKVFRPVLGALTGRDTEDVGGEATKAGFEEATGTDVDTTPGAVGEFAGETVPMAVGGGLTTSAVKNAPWIAKSAAQGAMSFGMQSMNEGEINDSSVVAGLVDAAIPAGSKFLEIGGGVLKSLAGSFSGAGVDAVEAALARPGAAFKAAGSNSDEGLKALAQSVREGTKNLYKKAGKEYAKTVSKAGVQQLPKNEVLDGVAAKLADLADAKVGKEGLELVDTPFTDIEERQLQKMYNVVSKWEDFTPEGVNTLATRISKFRRGAQDSAQFDRVVDGVRKYVRGYVGEKFPSIAEAVTKYSDKMDLLDEIDNVLKTSPEMGTREGIRKTAESLGRIFNANKSLSRGAIEELEKDLGVDIVGTMAGMQLSDMAPRSASTIGDATMNLVRPVGSIAARNLVPLTGAAKQQVIDRIMAIPGIPETTRAALVKAIADGFSEPDQSVPESADEKSR